MTDLEILMKGRLTQVRVAQMTADRLDVKSDGGSLVITATTSIGSSSGPTKAVAKVKLNVKGIPKGAARDTEDIAFSVGLEVRGLFDWPFEVEEKSFKNREFISLLCQPLYLHAAKKAEGLIADLGIRGVKLDTDARLISDQEAATTTMTVEPSTSKRKAPKRPGAKPGTRRVKASS